jgi:hypothetical protein
MRSRFSTTCLLAIALFACRPDTVAMSYRFEPGSSTSYRMQATAAASWNIGGPGEGSYEVVFNVTETVKELRGEDTVVSVTMTPQQVKENGLPSPGSKERTFVLLLGPQGEVKDVLEVDGVPADALDPDELAFIGTYRPPLPVNPVGLRDTWQAEQRVRLDSVFQQIVTTGTLKGLDRDPEGRLASLEYEGRGPLVWTTTLPQGEADLTGSSTNEAEALLDIDGGFLRSAHSITEGDFDVRVLPGGREAPIVGTLSLRLELRLTAGN